MGKTLSVALGLKAPNSEPLGDDIEFLCRCRFCVRKRGPSNVLIGGLIGLVLCWGGAAVKGTSSAGAGREADANSVGV
jgi:hypothetical protein